MKDTISYWKNRAKALEAILEKSIKEGPPLVIWFRENHPEIYRQGVAEILNKIGDGELKSNYLQKKKGAIIRHLANNSANNKPDRAQ